MRFGALIQFVWIRSNKVVLKYTNLKHIMFINSPELLKLHDEAY